jgi:hypothetical protein
MVDEKALPDGRSRMDFDTGQETHDMREPARQELRLAHPQPVGNAVPPHGMQARIAYQNFKGAARGRVPLKYRPDVVLHHGKEFSDHKKLPIFLHFPVKVASKSHSRIGV